MPVIEVRLTIFKAALLLAFLLISRVRRVRATHCQGNLNHVLRVLKLSGENTEELSFIVIKVIWY